METPFSTSLPQAAMKAEPLSRLLRPTLWLISAMLLICAVILQLRLMSYLDYDGEALRSDSESLYALLHVRAGQSPYHDFTVPPHVIAIYGPLFYYFPGTMARWMGASWMETVVVGRCYGYFFWLGIALILCLLVRQYGGSRFIAMLAALLWLSSRVSPEWAVAYRPDSAALFFSLAAVWLYEGGSGSLRRMGVVACLALAFLHKQSAVAAMAVILAEELQRNRKQQAALMLAGWGVTVAAAMGGAQVASGGAFFMNAFKTLAQRTEPSQIVYLALAAMTRGATGFVGGIFACSTVPADRCPRLLKRYFCVATAVALVGSIKAWADVNYFLEPFAISCLLTSTLVEDWLLRAAGRVQRCLRLGWLALALGSSVSLLFFFGARTPRYLPELVNHHQVRQQQSEAWEAVLRCLDHLGQPVLIEDMYLTLRRPVEPYLLHAAQFATLQQIGLFDDTNLLKQIDSGQFESIIASFPLEANVPKRQFPPRWIDLMRRRYVLVNRCDLAGQGKGFYVYRPRASDHREASPN